MIQFMNIGNVSIMVEVDLPSTSDPKPMLLFAGW